MTRRTRRALAAMAVTALAASLLSACSSAPAAPSSFAVGVVTQTFSRLGPGPASTSTSSALVSPAPVHRMLPTAIYYPAAGPAAARVTASAHPDTTFGPYPLIVFAPGFATPPDLAPYPTLLERWAAAGFVVAAPAFPYTSSNAPGGPDLSDFPNQPADLSAVIDHVLADSAARHGRLAGMVDARHIGAAGHSLGGVTVLGLVADTCCRDRRIDAAVVMSGDAITFPSGTPDFAAAPPLLLVHGSADPTVPYVSSVEAFNAAHGPKGLLTVVGGDHGAPVDPTGRAFSGVVRATTDFFDAYLGHRAGALARLRAAARPGVTTLTFLAGPTPKVTLPVPTTTVGHLQGTVTPDTGLADGQTVTVSWQGFTPDVSVNVLQCSRNPPTVAGDCDLHTGVLLHPDPTGSGSVPIVVHTGAVGTDGGVCGAGHPPCLIAVNQGGSLAPDATVTVPLAFASG